MSRCRPTSPTPVVFQTTGFLAVYVWGNVDNATWCAFLMYQLYFTFVILNEALLNYKNTFIWALVFFALAANIATSIAGFFLLDCLTFSTNPDPNTCNSRLHAYYVLSAASFLSGFFLLYYRKIKVVPDTLVRTGALDAMVVVTSMGLNLAANLPCMYRDIGTCFLQDIYQAVACGITFVYFDVWFLIKVLGKSFAGGAAASAGGTAVKKAEILQLSSLTGSLTLVYLAGSVCYKTWGGNFYTNIMWNMGYCLLPLYCVDSIVSPKFLKIFNPTSQRNSAGQRIPTTDRSSVAVPNSVSYVLPVFFLGRILTFVKG
ncbi:hypothetical protein BC830DRAFT_680826 [Chytriomyces sp. MP71]|nr:hypothetical protein BC830DRAFT_680826 [Chytriomyces sp. MP71]